MTTPPDKSDGNVAADFAAKIVEYVFTLALFFGVCALVAGGVMAGFDLMHRYEPAVPPLGFMFLLGAVWVLAVVVTFIITMIKSASDDE